MFSFLHKNKIDIKDIIIKYFSIKQWKYFLSFQVLVQFRIKMCWVRFWISEKKFHVWISSHFTKLSSACFDRLIYVFLIA